MTAAAVNNTIAFAESVVLTHASTVASVYVDPKLPRPPPVTYSLDAALNVTAVSGSVAIAPVAPSVGVLTYVPSYAAEPSALSAVVPDDSPSRQYAYAPSASTCSM